MNGNQEESNKKLADIYFRKVLNESKNTGKTFKENLNQGNYTTCDRVNGVRFCQHHTLDDPIIKNMRLGGKKQEPNKTPNVVIGDLFLHDEEIGEIVAFYLPTPEGWSNYYLVEINYEDGEIASKYSGEIAKHLSHVEVDSWADPDFAVFANKEGRAVSDQTPMYVKGKEITLGKLKAEIEQSKNY